MRRDPDEGEPPQDGGGQVVVGQQGVEVVVGLAAHVTRPVHVGGQPQGPGVCVVASPRLALADEGAQQDGRGDGQRQGETAHLQDHKAGDQSISLCFFLHLHVLMFTIAFSFLSHF